MGVVTDDRWTTDIHPDNRRLCAQVMCPCRAFCALCCALLCAVLDAVLCCAVVLTLLYCTGGFMDGVSGKSEEGMRQLYSPT